MIFAEFGVLVVVLCLVVGFFVMIHSRFKARDEKHRIKLLESLMYEAEADYDKDSANALRQMIVKQLNKTSQT